MDMQVYRTALELLDAGRPFALAAVVETAGSTPQKPGAKALFDPAGACWGTLGGGCLEAEARKRALDAIDEGARLYFALNLDEDHGWDDGLICGGKAHIFVDANVAENAGAYRAACDAHGAGRRGVLITTVAHGGAGAGRAIWVEEADLSAYTGYPGVEALTACLVEERPRYFDPRSERHFDPAQVHGVFVEPIAPPPRLLIAGGGHVGQATAHMAAALGFAVTVIDDRPDFTRPALFPPGTETRCGDIAAEVGQYPMGADTYVLIVTRGHRNDASVLAACIHAPAAFIGMIGSRRKIALIRKQFVRDGIATEADFARIASPVGLDIGSVTVPEIACSICAQLIAVRRKCATPGRVLSLTAEAADAVT